MIPPLSQSVFSIMFPRLAAFCLVFFALNVSGQPAKTRSGQVPDRSPAALQTTDDELTRHMGAAQGYQLAAI
jgi:hypothetical protein